MQASKVTSHFHMAGTLCWAIQSVDAAAHTLLPPTEALGTCQLRPIAEGLFPETCSQSQAQRDLGISGRVPAWGTLGTSPLRPTAGLVTQSGFVSAQSSSFPSAAASGGQQQHLRRPQHPVTIPLPRILQKAPQKLCDYEASSVNMRPPRIGGLCKPSHDIIPVSSPYSLLRGRGSPRSADEDTEALGQLRWPEEGRWSPERAAEALGWVVSQKAKGVS